MPKRTLQEQKDLWSRWKSSLRADFAPEEWEKQLLNWKAEADIAPDLLDKLIDWDWQLYKFEQLSEVRGHTFSRRDYKPLSTEWEHEHCLGCWAKFVDSSYYAPNDDHEIYHDGFVTYAKSDWTAASEAEVEAEAKQKGLNVTIQPSVNGQFEIWVCMKCFEQFRDHLDFKLSSN
jgi:hypothetical protein